MQTKIVIVLSIILTLLVAVTLVKFRAPKEDSNHLVNKVTLAQQDEIQQFWQIYRQATKQRIAGNLKSAAERYREALALNEQHEDALYYLGNIYLELGQFKQAEQAWKRLVQINPNSARGHTQLGTLYLDVTDEDFFDVNSAEIEFKKALEINKEETGPMLHLGHISLIQGNLPEAGRYFDAVIGSNYRSVEAYFLNGFVAWKNGDTQKALQMLSKAIKYAQPEKPVRGVPGEGATKAGESLRQSKPRTLFQMHLDDLAGMDKPELARQMKVRYQKLDEFLAQLREKTHSL